MSSFAVPRPRPSSRSALAASLLAALLALPAAAAAPQALGTGATLAAAHDGSVVWARPVTGRVDLLLSDVLGGDPELLASVSAARGGQVAVQGLAFDGRRVAWIDGRFGPAEAFALDLSTGAQSRITTTPMSETGVAVEGDQLAWTGPGGAFLHSFADGSARPLEASPADNPVFWRGAPAWVTGQGEARELHALEDGQVRTIDGDRAWFIHHVGAEGPVMAWQAWHLEPGTAGIAGYQVRARIGDGPVLNLTPLLVAPPSGPWVANGRVAWGQAGGEAFELHVREEDGALTRLAVPDPPAALAGAHAVLLGADGDLRALALEADASGKGAPGLAWTSLALLVPALAGSTRDRRGRA